MNPSIPDEAFVLVSTLSDGDSIKADDKWTGREVQCNSVYTVHAIPVTVFAVMDSQGNQVGLLHQLSDAEFDADVIYGWTKV